MDLFTPWLAEYGVLALIMLGGFAFIAFRLKEGRARMERIEQAVTEHDRACQEDRVRRSNWEGKVEVWLKSFNRRMSAIERGKGVPPSDENGLNGEI